MTLDEWGETLEKNEGNCKEALEAMLSDWWTHQDAQVARISKLEKDNIFQWHQIISRDAKIKELEEQNKELKRAAGIMTRLREVYEKVHEEHDTSMTDEEVLAFIEIYDENLKDMVTGLLFERQRLQGRVEEREENKRLKRNDSIRRDAIEKLNLQLNDILSNWY